MNSIETSWAGGSTSSFLGFPRELRVCAVHGSRDKIEMRENRRARERRAVGSIFARLAG